MSDEAKKLLIGHFHNSELEKTLESIPTCSRNVIVEFCPPRPGTKRARSEYQEFISKCMKGKNIHGFGQAPAAMRECAAEWREQK
jgi:hypothetical protein